MTDEQIIALAKQLGWNVEHQQTNVMLVKFANAVATAEREECAKIAETAEPYQAADLIRSRT